jgi:hypothetical protein
MREVCAFIGELAQLSYASYTDVLQYHLLSEVWKEDNQRYLGTHADRLKSILLKTEEEYRYSWNYPIARYLAIEIYRRRSRDWMWALFEGDQSVREILRELDDNGPE